MVWTDIHLTNLRWIHSTSGHSNVAVLILKEIEYIEYIARDYHISILPSANCLLKLSRNL